MKAERYTLLVVEDNPSDAFLIEEMLQSSALPVEKIYLAERRSEALHILDTHPVDVVLLDLSLPDSFGIDSFLLIKERFLKTAVIILTGLSDSEIAFQALQNGAQDYLVKGDINTGMLVKSIQYSIERKRAKEDLQRSEEKYRQIFYKNPLPMWISDAETLQVLEVNDAAVEVYGYSKEEFLSLSLHDIQGGYSEPLLLPFAGHPGRQLWRHLKKNGNMMMVECTRYPVPYLNKDAIQMQIHDLTGQVRLERELALKNQQMIEAVLQAQEQERRVLGEELHDNINQILAAVKIGLGFALEQEEPNRNVLSKCLHNSTLAIEEIRKLSRSLIVPSNLRELGLDASLDILIKDLQSITDMEVVLNTHRLLEQELGEDHKTTLYRIVQEQMNNIMKHARANKVVIELLTHGGNIHLTISDNGRGFDTTKKANGIGFHNINNRVKLFNGSLHVESSPGNGCRLTATIQVTAPQPLAFA